jgi:hypothetical protein
MLIVRKKKKNKKKEYLGDNVTRFLVHLKEFELNWIAKLLTIAKLIGVCIGAQKWELLQFFSLITMALVFLNFEFHN